MLQDKLILSHLRRKHTLNESIEEITPETLYKIDDNTRIEIQEVIKDVWKFSLITSEESKDIGKVYKVSDNDYVARSLTAPNLEANGKTLIDAATELCVMLGEI
jgi:hypothetical protein